MSNDTGARLRRIIMVGLLMLATLGFGAIGLCGGYVTLLSLPALLGARGYVAAFLIFSVPCLIAGIVVVKVCIGRMHRLMSLSQTQDRLHE